MQAVSTEGEETSKEPPSLRAKLALEPAEPPQLSWFSHLHALPVQAGSLCPTHQTSPALLHQQSVGAAPAGVGAPHQGGAEPLCPAPLQLHLLPALPGSGQPAVLPNPVWNAAAKDYGRVRDPIGVPRKEESRGWKRSEEQVGSKPSISAEGLQAPRLSSSSLAFASH